MNHLTPVRMSRTMGRRFTRAFLPKQLSDAEVQEKIKQIITEVGASSPADFGKVMPMVMKELKGKADGKVIQESVKRLLGA